MNISENLVPTYNLKVVVQETGIKPHTLRAWERRYGLPMPERTSGGHRLYCQRDIEMIKWLINRQEEGLSISRAVELWQNLEKKGQDPIITLSQRQEDHFLATEVGLEMSRLRQRWIENCLKFDELAAENVLTQAFAIFPVKMVCLEVLQKGLAHIGELWYQNKASVQQEHFASALTIKRIINLLATAPPPTRIGRVVMACPPHEEHTISLLMLLLLLRYKGWSVVYLGANVPIIRLESALDTIKPDLVIMSAQRLRTAASLANTARFLYKKEISMAFGGLAFNLIPALRQRISGHFLGEDLEEAVTAVSQIMTFNPTIPEVAQVPEEYVRATNSYQSKRPFIEMEAWQLSETYGMPYEYIDTTNTRLSEAITAALYLGEIDLIDIEFDMHRQLIKNYGISVDWQGKYFDAYYRAAHKHLQNDGRPIINWLNKARASYQGA